MPAVTANPSDSIAFAYCLASRSAENDFVFLGEGVRDGDGARDDLGRQSLGPFTETYQRLVIFVYLATMAPWALKHTDNIMSEAFQQ